jgi:MFS family permease
MKLAASLVSGIFAMSAPSSLIGGESRSLRILVVLLATAQLIIALDATIVFVALPQIGVALGFSKQNLQWVISAYTVTFGGFLLLGGRAADVIGRRRMYVIGQILFAISSLAGGLAESPSALVIARAVQGIGAAFLFPATLSMINTRFDEGAARTHLSALPTQSDHPPC